MKTNTTIGVLLGFALAVVAGACVKKDTNVPGDKTACTEEAKVCPDGSSVGRTGPDCQFAECPAGEEKPAEGEPAEGEPADDKPAEDAPADA
jgi:hypothetical protein